MCRTEIGRGLVLFVSFARGAGPCPEESAVGREEEAASRLKRAARSLLSAPLSTGDRWQADHSDAESVAALCRRGVQQGLLVVPQASLVCKLELGDRNVKYHAQCTKEQASELYHGLVDALRVAARELVAGPGPKHDPAAYQAIKAQRAAAALVAPDRLFKTSEYDGKYSRYDERGVPTHDAAGQELAKSAQKKLEKLYAAQVKKFSKASAASEPGAGDGAGASGEGEVAAEAPAAATADAAATAAAQVLEPELPEGACLPEVRAGTFGGRQGFEMASGGPFTHMFVF